jgi:hypothetical protein
MSLIGGMSGFCALPFLPTPTALPLMQKSGCPARHRSMSQVALLLTDGIPFGQHGLWMTFTHIRMYILQVTPDTVPFAMGKMKRQFLSALHSLKSENDLEALI